MGRAGRATSFLSGTGSIQAVNGRCNDHSSAINSRANSPTREIASDGDAARSISATMAEPTTAASAYRQTSLTCSGLEIPKPTATGKPEKRLTRATNFSASALMSSRAPVTPARDTA
jgi:hypothetical protein